MLDFGGGLILPLALPRLIRRAQTWRNSGILVLRTVYVMIFTAVVFLGILGALLDTAFDWGAGAAPALIGVSVAGLVGIVVERILPTRLSFESAEALSRSVWDDRRRRVAVGMVGAIAGAAGFFLTGLIAAYLIGGLATLISLANSFPRQSWFSHLQSHLDREGCELVVVDVIRTQPPRWGDA